MGFIDKFKDIVNPKDIDEGYEDDEYVFDEDVYKRQRQCCSGV